MKRLEKLIRFSRILIRSAGQKASVTVTVGATEYAVLKKLLEEFPSEWEEDCICMEQPLQLHGAGYHDSDCPCGMTPRVYKEEIKDIYCVQTPTPAKPAGEVCAVCGEPEDRSWHQNPSDWVGRETHSFQPAPAEPKGEVGRLTVDRLHSYAMDYAKAGLGGDPDAAKRCLELEAALSSLQQPESARVRELEHPANEMFKWLNRLKMDPYTQSAVNDFRRALEAALAPSSSGGKP